MTPRLRIALIVLAASRDRGFSSGPIVAHFAAGRFERPPRPAGSRSRGGNSRCPDSGSVRLSRVVAARAQEAALPTRCSEPTRLAVALDLGSLWSLRPRVGSLGLWRAQIRLPARDAAEFDTLVPDDRPGGRASKEDPARAARLRHSAESWVRLLSAPARRLPRLELNDVEISTGNGEDASIRGLRIARLDLKPVAGRHSTLDGRLTPTRTRGAVHRDVHLRPQGSHPRRCPVPDHGFDSRAYGHATHDRGG